MAYFVLTHAYYLFSTRYLPEVCNANVSACPYLDTDVISTVRYSSEDDIQYNGTIATYACKEGYTALDTTTLHCNILTWNGTECRLVDCMDISTPDHASVNYTNGTTFQGQAHIWCEPGFNISGPSVLTCNEAGVWEPSLSYCNAISKSRLSLGLINMAILHN